MNLLPRRVIAAAIAVPLASACVGIFQFALFGADPCSCMLAGLSQAVSLPFGVVCMLFHLSVGLLVLRLDRRYLGLSSLLFIFVSGYIVDFCRALLEQLIPAPSLGLRVILLAVGIVVQCFACALCYSADLGVAPYDALPLILADRQVAPFRLCRIATDVICVLLALLLRAVVGIGTLILAGFMGPLISFFRTRVTDPLVHGTVAAPAACGAPCCAKTK